MCWLRSGTKKPNYPPTPPPPPQKIIIKLKTKAGAELLGGKLCLVCLQIQKDDLRSAVKL